MSGLRYDDGRDYETSVLYAVFECVSRLEEAASTTRDEIICRICNTP